MKKPRDSSYGAGLDVVVTLPASVVDQIKAAAKERGETVEGWCRAKLIALVEDPGSDERIRAVLDAPTNRMRLAAADRLTDADWERLAKGVELTPADLEAAAAETEARAQRDGTLRLAEEMERYAREADMERCTARGPLNASAEDAAAEMERRAREPDPDR